MKYLFVIALLLANANAASAEDMAKSKYWLDLCNNTWSEEKQCVGYVQGYLHGTNYAAHLTERRIINAEYQNSVRIAFRNNAKFLSIVLRGCLTDDITTAQIVKLWMVHLKNSPDTLNLPPIVTLSNSLREAFPCN